MFPTKDQIFSNSVTGLEHQEAPWMLGGESILYLGRLSKPTQCVYLEIYQERKIRHPPVGNSSKTRVKRSSQAAI